MNLQFFSFISSLKAYWSSPHRSLHLTLNILLHMFIPFNPSLVQVSLHFVWFILLRTGPRIYPLLPPEDNPFILQKTRVSSSGAMLAGKAFSVLLFFIRIGGSSQRSSSSHLPLRVQKCTGIFEIQGKTAVGCPFSLPHLKKSQPSSQFSVTSHPHSHPKSVLCTLQAYWLPLSGSKEIFQISK